MTSDPNESGGAGSLTPPSDSSIPPIPIPFRPSEPLVGPGRGCGTPALVGCGLAALLLVVSMVLVIANSPKLVGWAFSQSRQAILEKMPDDITEAEQKRFETAFDKAVEAVIDKKVEQEGLRTLSNELRDAVTRAGSGDLSKADVQRLSEVLEKLVADGTTAHFFQIRSLADHLVFFSASI